MKLYFSKSFRLSRVNGAIGKYSFGDNKHRFNIFLGHPFESQLRGDKLIDRVVAGISDRLSRRQLQVSTDLEAGHLFPKEIE